MLNHIITPNSITILINNVPEVIDNSHGNFAKVEQALKDGASEADILRLMNIGEAVKHFAVETEGKVQVKNGEILYCGEVVHSALSRRIITLMNEGFDISPFTKFMENLFRNPSNRAVNETYGFLEACNLPITENGTFLAYKKITKDYKDCYTKTIDNSIGAVPEVPRNKVDEDSNRTCSYGLHVASYSYMAHYPGDRIVICEVDPADVVAVPSDYNNAKMRVCKYKVVNEVNVKDEEIPENVIKDEDAYDSSLRPFKNLDDALMAVRQDSFREIAERLKVTNVNIEQADKKLIVFSELFSGMNNRTKNWRNQLLNIFEGVVSEDSEDSENAENTENTENTEDELLNDIKILRLTELKELYGEDTIISELLSKITNSTYRWRDLLTNTVLSYESTETEPKVDTEDGTEKLSFRKKVQSILEQLDFYNRRKLYTWIMSHSEIRPDFIRACANMSDHASLAKAIAKAAKAGQFKKKKFLNLWKS